jgi:phosphoserine phosphatase
LKRLGYRTAILSGGFTYFAKRFQAQFGIDYVHANELEIVDGKLTGNVLGEIVDEQRKAQALRDIVAREGICVEQAIAIGDGANDIAMLSVAGLGIAFHAKAAVREQADYAVAHVGLDAILYLLGMREEEISY